MDKKFIGGKAASMIIGVHQQTLYKYADEGTIETIRTPGGKRLYNIQGFLEKNTNAKNRKKVCYCRVSTRNQKNDLERQIKYMKSKYPDYEIIRDIGSGINFKRKGLQRLIRYAINGDLEKLAIAHKDRLCRIGYELIEFILQTYSKTEIIIEEVKKESPEEEVVNDLLQIITVFGARVNGLRSYKKLMKNDKRLSKII